MKVERCAPAKMGDTVFVLKHGTWSGAKVGMDTSDANKKIAFGCAPAMKGVKLISSSGSNTQWKAIQEVADRGFKQTNASV